tara:strand:+ start:73 stop:339 length:267 start_codon:yes stop_codon:yes gene_type:complete
VPLVEYAQKTVGKAYNRTTPNFPIAFHAMNELVRSHVESKVAQALASGLFGGCFQRQIMPQAAPSFAQPRPISRVGRAGRPPRPLYST